MWRLYISVARPLLLASLAGTEQQWMPCMLDQAMISISSTRMPMASHCTLQCAFSNRYLQISPQCQASFGALSLQQLATYNCEFQEAWLRLQLAGIFTRHSFFMFAVLTCIKEEATKKTWRFVVIWSLESKIWKWGVLEMPFTESYAWVLRTSSRRGYFRHIFVVLFCMILNI